MRYLVEPIVDNLSLGKEDHGVGTNACPPHACWNYDCYNFELCHTPTGPKMIS